MEELFTIRIGHTFWDDHVSRECLSHNGPDHHTPEEYEVKRGERMVTLALPHWQLDELLSDAEYYSESSWNDYGDGSLAASARTLVRSVRKQMVAKSKSEEASG